jgi:NADH dehydrogenase FAD-containing subunit
MPTVPTMPIPAGQAANAQGKAASGLHRIIIGGGAAADGLELATRLGDALGRKGKAEVTLVDKAPDFLRDIAGLETNRINQLVVRPSLETTRDDAIFAIGDCAACPWPEANAGKGGTVPPRAQAAHQQAALGASQIIRRMRGQPLAEYR